jgi:hypothetical protein
MGLLKAARGETPRYAVESVVSLLTGKLGRWLQPVKDGRRPWPLVDKNVNELAAAAVELDLYVGFLDGARARITLTLRQVPPSLLGGMGIQLRRPGDGQRARLPLQGGHRHHAAYHQLRFALSERLSRGPGRDPIPSLLRRFH